MPSCECQHHVVRIARLRTELKPLDYSDSNGKPIDPDWLTITHNQIGKECCGGGEGYTMEYRRNNGSVITWEEFKSIDDAVRTAEKWHRVARNEWQPCFIEDSGEPLPMPNAVL